MPQKTMRKKKKIKGGGYHTRTFRYLTNKYRKKAIANGNPRPVRLLEDGELHFGLHNFTGPGTKIGLEKVRNFEPYNNIDACSKDHDLEYFEAEKLPLSSSDRMRAIRKADQKVINCYDQFPDENGYSQARAGIKTKMYMEDKNPAFVQYFMGKKHLGGIASKEDVHQEKKSGGAFNVESAWKHWIDAEYQTRDYQKPKSNLKKQGLPTIFYSNDAHI